MCYFGLRYVAGISNSLRDGIRSNNMCTMDKFIQVWRVIERYKKCRVTRGSVRLESESLTATRHSVSAAIVAAWANTASNNAHVSVSFFFCDTTRWPSGLERRRILGFNSRSRDPGPAPAWVQNQKKSLQLDCNFTQLPRPSVKSWRDPSWRIPLLKAHHQSGIISTCVESAPTQFYD